jgi:hypothetical protein
MIKTFSIVTLAATSWYVTYKYITDRIERSSLLVRQTIFNLSNNDSVADRLGDNLRIDSPLTGFQSQRKGDADIEFKVIGSKGNH